MTAGDFSRLKRAIHEMPDWIIEALERAGDRYMKMSWRPEDSP